MAAEAITSADIEQAMGEMRVVNYLMLDGSASTNFYYDGQRKARGIPEPGRPPYERLVGSVIQVHEK